MQKTVQKVMSSGVIALSLVMADFSYADNLDIVVKSAPIVPDGLIAGKPLDVTFSFVDLNPEVPGIGLKKGATAKVYLPKQVINLGYPV